MSSDRCRRCNRTLTDPESREREIGPECAAKEQVEKADQGMLPIGEVLPALRGRAPGAARLQPARRAPPARTWTYVLEGAFVVVTDLGTGRSVTNQAAEVLLELGREVSLTGRRVIYRDTDGRWDELLHEGVFFRGFAPIGSTGTYRDAIESATRRTS